MRNTIVFTSTIAALFIIAISACKNSSTDAKPNDQQMDSTALVVRGKYLVSSMGCDDCHSPKRMGAHGPEIIPELRFSGFQHDAKLPPFDSSVVKKGWALFSTDLTAAIGPWGASFAANISSDETGLGNWTSAQFIKAIREGKSKGLDAGRPMLPPMPWYNFANLTDEDLKSIFAYLKTTAPVNNVVPGPKTFAEIQ